MAKRWAVAVAFAAGIALLGAAWLLRPAEDVPAAVARAGRDRAGTRESLPPAADTPPPPLLPGALTGRVTRAGAGVAGAQITVTEEQERSLSREPCVKVDPDMPDTACALQWSRQALLERIEDGTGDVVAVASAVSDAEGRFVFPTLPGGRYGVWFEDATGAALRTGISPGGAPLEVELEDGHQLDAYVYVDDEAADEVPPIAGARVIAFNVEHSRLFEAVTDGEGFSRIGPLPPGDYVVVGVKQGFVPQSDLAEVDGATEVDLFLSAPRIVSGVVRRVGGPVAGCEVVVTVDHESRTVVTDGAGRFRAAGFGNGEGVAEARCHDEGGVSDFFSVLGRNVAVEIAVSAGHWVEGRVTGADGRPVEAVGISARLGGSYEGGYPPETVTDRHGRFRLGPREPGEWAVVASKDGYADAWSTVTLDEQDAELALTLKRVVQVRGRVVDELGEPVAIAAVEATLGEDVSLTGDVDDDGKFELRPELPGTYSLAISSPRHPAIHLEAVLPWNGERSFTLPAGLQVSGTVLDSGGAPTSANVTAFSLGGGTTRVVSADEETGAFTLEGLTPGAWMIEARTGHPLEQVSQLVSVPADGLLLRLPHGPVVQGSVVTRDGAPISGAMIQLAPEAGGESTTMWSDSSGAFEEPVSPGAYRAVVVSIGGEKLAAFGSARVVADGPPVRLVLEELRTVHGRVVDGRRAPVTSFQVDRDFVDDPDGRFEAQVRRSDRTIRIEAEELRVEVPVPEHADDLGEIVLREEGRRQVRGRVIDARTGAGLGGATVSLQEAEGDELWSGQTDRDGAFEIPRVTSLAAKLGVSRFGYLDAELPIPAAGAPWELPLQRGGKLTVRVDAGPDGFFHGSVLVLRPGPPRWGIRQTGVTEGVFWLEGGRYQVSAAQPDGEAWGPQDADVVVGGTVEVVLRR